MKSISLLALALCALFVASCSDSETIAPEYPKVVYAIPGVGTQYDISWSRFDPDGVQLPQTRNDTIVHLYAKDSTVFGNSGVTAYGYSDSRDPLFFGRDIFMRVNRNNDLEVVLHEDELTFDKWIVFPVQTRSRKTIALDTTIEGMKVVGSIVTTHQDIANVTVAGNTVEVHKIQMILDLQALVGSTVQADVVQIRNYWYAPSLGYFTLIEEESQGFDVEGDDAFDHVKEEMEQYQLQ